MNELYHFGIKGMKWDVRRYQNKDGSLTPEGKRRLQIGADGKVGSANKKSPTKKTTSTSSSKSGSDSKAKTEGSTKASTASKSESSLDKAKDEVFKKQMVEANNQASGAMAKVYEKWADKLQGYGDIKKSPYFEKYIKEYSEVLESSMNAHARVSGNKNIEVDGDVYEIKYKVTDGIAEAVLKKVPDSKNDNEDEEEKPAPKRRRKKTSISQMDANSNTLAHFGILGMKWGVRRYQNDDGSLTKAGEARYEGSGRNRDKDKDYTGKQARMDRFNEDQATKGLRIEKGSTINRIAKAGDETKSGMKYAAFTKSDVDEYEFALGGTGNKFNFTYKAKEVLVSPNEKKQVDAFIDTVKDLKVSQVASAIKTKSKFSTMKGLEKDLRKAVEGDPKLRTKTYSKFMDLLYDDALASVKSNYFSRLSKEGYNMIIDSSDRGLVSDNPVIIFNGSKSMEFIKKKRLS